MGRLRRRGIGHEAEGGRAVLVILLVLAVLVGSAWVAAYAGANGKVPEGTTVAGVDVGGRDRAEAARALARGMAGRANEPLQVTVGTLTTPVTAAEAGLSVDHLASVSRALGPRSWDPRRLWGYYTGGGEVAPVVAVDATRMDALLHRLDAEAGQPPRDAGISLAGGRIELTRPRDGAQLDHERARAAIVAAWAEGEDAVTLPLLLSPAAIGQAELDRAVRELANPALSGPVTLTFAASEVTLRPREYADLLTVAPRDGVLALDVDAAALAALVDPAAQDVAPVDATVAMVDGAPAVVPAVAGRAYDPAGVAEAFLRGVVGSGSERIVPIEGTPTKAAFTTRDARRLGVVEPVASYSLAVPASAGTAFTDAVAGLSGALLRPGDTFSFNARVGPVNRSGSRLSTATWNAGFLAGLTDVARTPSPTWSAALPEGRDAVVAAGGADLQLRNDSAYGVLLDARVADGSVVVDVWSTRTWDVTAATGARYAPTPPTTLTDASPTCVPQPGSEGFTVDLVRTFTHLDDAAQTRTDTVTTTYLPVEAVVCQPAPG